MYRLLFVVCHPDDEALWVGGLLHALSKFPFLEVNVICLSGRDPNSPREDEFNDAKKIAGYHQGVVLGGELRQANTPLPPVAKTLEEGLQKIGLKIQDISLLITHSPYGDEHLHPHHVQTYNELFQWTCETKIPFSFFSCLPLPYLIYQPLLKNLKRFRKFHLLNFSKCRSMLWFFKFLINKLLNLYTPQPRYYFLFNTDGHVKQKMINCYQSINIKEHLKGYGMSTNSCESLYIFDKSGLQPFQAVMDFMDIPGPKDLFKSISLRGSLKSKLLFWKKS